VALVPAAPKAHTQGYDPTRAPVLGVVGPARVRRVPRVDALAGHRPQRPRTAGAGDPGLHRRRPAHRTPPPRAAWPRSPAGALGSGHQRRPRRQHGAPAASSRRPVGQGQRRPHRHRRLEPGWHHGPPAGPAPSRGRPPGHLARQPHPGRGPRGQPERRRADHRPAGRVCSGAGAATTSPRSPCRPPRSTRATTAWWRRRPAASPSARSPRTSRCAVHMSAWSTIPR
jgi:hypothetical protein